MNQGNNLERSKSETCLNGNKIKGLPMDFLIYQLILLLLAVFQK